MKVIIDISPLRTGHKTRGIGVYTRELIEALHAVDKKNQYILTTKSEEIKNADIIHYPYFDLFFHTLPIIKKAKTVVTIHDIIPLIFPRDFQVGIRGKINLAFQKLALRNVDAIITDSQNSKKDILDYFAFEDHMVDVIYLAASSEFKPQSSSEILRIKKKYQLPHNFILYVGDVNPNKNLVRLLEAFKKVLKEKPDINLVLIGRAFREDIVEVRLIKAKIAQLVLLNQVKILADIPLDPAKDLVAVYNAAACYVQPSLYEGFGLPIIEAFACGTPVVAGQSSSIPELVGDSAILVNPNSYSDIASGLIKVLSLNKKQKSQMIKKGIEQAGKFSWNKTAQQTINVYKSLL